MRALLYVLLVLASCGSAAGQSQFYSLDTHFHAVDFSVLTGRATCLQLPALSGNVTSAAGSCVVTVSSVPAGALPAINLAASGAGGVTGNLPIGNLAGGTAASNLTYWRGDGSWTQPNCAALSDAAASCATDATNASNISSGNLNAARLPQIAAGSIMANLTGSSAVPSGWAVNASNSVAGTGLPGFDQQTLFLYKTYSSPEPSGELAVLRVQKGVNYSGGTLGNTYFAGWFTLSVGASVNTNQWAVLGAVQNYTTGGVTGGSSVGVYGQGWKMADGGSITWAAVSEGRDTTGSANPVSGLATHEFDTFANGTDAYNTRVAADIVGGKHNAGGAAPEIAYGIRVGPANGDTTQAVYKNVLYAYGNIVNGINFTNATLTGNPFASPGFSVDASGNLIAANVSGAWTAYTPTAACAGGSLTSATAAGRYKQLGKTIFIEAKLTITTAGTCSGLISLSLPNSTTAKADVSLSGRESGSTGKALVAYIPGTFGALYVGFYDGGTTWSNGYALVLGGVYEAQ